MTDEDAWQRWQNLRTQSLEHLARTEREIRRGFSRFSLDAIPLDDSSAFHRLIERPVRRLVLWGHSGRIWTALRQCKPSTITEYAATCAVWRPGPLYAGIYDAFRAGKLERSRDKTTRLLLPFTRSTRGVIVFQEQVLEASAVLFGFSPASQERLRRALATTIPWELERAKAEMVAAAGRRGMTRVVAESLFERMSRFGRYAWSRRTTLDCVTIAYKAAWLEVYYPREYRAAAGRVR